MKSRRKFLKITALGTAVVISNSVIASEIKDIKTKKGSAKVTKPIVVSTWNHGMAANEASWKILSKGGTALDAVEAGVRVTESDASNMSVGLGGLPDRDGFVTLDACIMDENNKCGSVAFLQDIENPISVARKVMEDTPHVMLTGEGARQFAFEKGFKKTNLLTPKAKKAWEEWKKKSNTNLLSTVKITIPLVSSLSMKMETFPEHVLPVVWLIKFTEGLATPLLLEQVYLLITKLVQLVQQEWEKL